MKPYFYEARVFRPVRKSDLFFVRGGMRNAKFKVIEIDPPENFAVVTPETEILWEGEPV